MRKTFLCLLMFLVLPCSAAWGATYYVCTGGNQSAPTDGTCANAYANLEDVFAGVNLAPGDRVEFLSDITESDHITWGADDGGDASSQLVIDGNGYTLTVTTGSSCILATGISYVTMLNIKVTGMFDDNDYGILLLKDCAGWVFDTTEWYGSEDKDIIGIELRGDDGEAPSDTEIKYSTFRNLNKGFFALKTADGADPIGIHIHDSLFHTFDQGDSSISDGVTIYNNPAAPMTNTGTIIEDNEFYAYEDQAIDTLGGGSITIRRNKIHDGAGGSSYGIKLGDANGGGTGLLVINNEIWNQEEHGINFGEASGTIANNTIYNVGGFGIMQDGACDAGAMTILNNVVDTCDVCFEWVTASITDIDHNDCYNFTTGAGEIDNVAQATWAGYQTAANVAIAGTGANSINADPQFVNASNNDFRLLGGSPAIGAGTSGGSIPTTDYNGFSTTGTKDMGAHEFAHTRSTSGRDDD